MENLSKIENVVVEICCARESSGNIQFFLRAKRTDDTSFMSLDGCLEYQCFQTKHEQTVKKCIDNAVFGSMFLLRFFGLTHEDIKLSGFDDEMIEFAKKSTKRWFKSL